MVPPDPPRPRGPGVPAPAGPEGFSHPAESSLRSPYAPPPPPPSRADRPPYQGANPVADVWSAKALEYGGRFLRRAVEDPHDLEARGAMMLAASMAGGGFGSARGHIPPARADPIAPPQQPHHPARHPPHQPLL